MIDLLNNSSEMKSFVETYLVEETVDLIYDQEKLNQWNEYVKELGLSGQVKTASKEKSPIQFMHMTPTMINVFHELCPVRVAAEDFSTVPIPLEILNLMALAHREQYFSKIEIWYDDKVKDPACVGIIESWGIDDSERKEVKKCGLFKTESEAKQYIVDNELTGHVPYNYTYRDVKMYLIGRWADVKATFSDLQQRAKDRYLLRVKSEIQQRIREEQRKLEDIELTATQTFGI